MSQGLTWLAEVKITESTKQKRRSNSYSPYLILNTIRISVVHGSWSTVLLWRRINVQIHKREKDRVIESWGWKETAINSPCFYFYFAVFNTECRKLGDFHICTSRRVLRSSVQWLSAHTPFTTKNHNWKAFGTKTGQGTDSCTNWSNKDRKEQNSKIKNWNYLGAHI